MATDNNGTRKTATDLGYIGATNFFRSDSVGEVISTIKLPFSGVSLFTYDLEDYFSFKVDKDAEYEVKLNTPTKSFVGSVDSSLAIIYSPDSSITSGLITLKATSPTGSDTFTTKSDSFRTKSDTYGIQVSRYNRVEGGTSYYFDSNGSQTKVDYNLTIKRINFFPDQLNINGLKSSYRQDESISMNELYVRDRDGWADVNDIKMDIFNGTKLVQSSSATSFTPWSGDNTYTWAKTSLNQSLKNIAPGNYTLRFTAMDKKLALTDAVFRQITITAANPVTPPPITPPVTPTTPLVEFKKDPAKYMGSIRDYDGNNLGSSNSWKLLGDVDIQKDGDLESILVNPALGRFASVGSVNGNIDFTKHGLGGDTRVVGIYIDPTLKNQPQNIGGPFDSQKRFQNDLKNDNLKLLAAGDYNNDGFQDLYFKLGDGSAVLRALMFKDGNIQYANYQNKNDLTAFMTSNNVNSSVWSGWI